MGPRSWWGVCNPEQYHRNTFNTMRPRQNGRHFPDDIFLNETEWMSIKISPKFVPRGPINNIPALVQIMAWRRSGDKPLSELMMVSLLTHICVTRPQCFMYWFKALSISRGVVSSKNPEKRPHSSPVKTRYGVFLWVHCLYKLLTFFPSYCVQHRIIFDRDISRVYGIWYSFHQPVKKQVEKSPLNFAQANLSEAHKTTIGQRLLWLSHCTCSDSSYIWCNILKYHIDIADSYYIGSKLSEKYRFIDLHGDALTRGLPSASRC